MLMICGDQIMYYALCMRNFVTVEFFMRAHEKK